MVAVGLAPDGLGLGLDAGDGAEHADAAVEDAEAALDLGREVDVAGRVDDVDLSATPLGPRRGRRDRDAALALLGHVVGRGRAVVDVADPVDTAREVEDPLGRGRLAGVDVGDDPDVADPLDRTLGVLDDLGDALGGGD